jgi:parvulin-like peptidyl-prolyl isomerase
MKSFLKISGWLIATMALSAAAATPGTPPAASAPASAPSINDLLPDTVVARGKGFEIKRSKLDQTVISIRASAAARGQEIPAEQLPLLEKQALDDLLLVKLLNGVATPEQKAKGEDEATTNFAATKKQFPTEELMVRQLKTLGMTPDEWRANIAEQATAHLVLVAKANITDDKVKEFYDNNPAQMEQEEKARVNFIMLGGADPVTGAPLANDQLAAKKKQMDDLRDRAQHGEDFAKLAQNYSENASTKDNGGEITLTRGSGRVPPEFETAAFALETNQVSDVITTQAGLFLIKLKERIPARKATLAEASPDIRRYLETVAFRKIVPDYLVQLKKDAGVEILDPSLKDTETPAAGQSGAIDMVPSGGKPATGTH